MSGDALRSLGDLPGIKEDELIRRGVPEGVIA